MKLVPVSVTLMGDLMDENTLLAFIGEIAGECYNSSRDKIACMNRALSCIRRGHHSPWEHYSITLKCTVDRGVSHALVRHRHCAFQQSSTVYQKYQECTFIGDPYDTPAESKMQVYRATEAAYLKALLDGEKPSEARDVLPNALATNLIITTNIRQWMYMIQRRCGPGDSDNMHEWCRLTRGWFEMQYPQTTAAFDIWYERHPL